MLSPKTYAHLKAMLTRATLADEFQALLSAPGVPSAKLQAAILAAMANKAAANEVIAALQTAGLQALSGNPVEGHRSPNAARRLVDALANLAAEQEIVSSL